MKVAKLEERLHESRLDRCAESLLVEGPVGDFLHGVKDKFSKKPLSQAEADKKAKEKSKKEIDKRRKNQDPRFLAKDFHTQNSKSIFYIDNNYNEPMTQSQWQSWLESQQEKIDNILVDPGDSAAQEKKARAQEKLDAQRYNAIVVNEHGYYMRRGAEPLEARIVKFVPGENDEIRNGYFLEPYKYKKFSGSRTKSDLSGSSSVSKQDISKFLTIQEITGMVIVDSSNKEIDSKDVKKIPVKELSSYKVKLGSVGVPILDWIETAKSRKLI